MADQVLYSGVACITDLIVKEGLINLDFADVRAVMREKGKAMMGMGEASGEKRVLTADDRHRQHRRGPADAVCRMRTHRTCRQPAQRQPPDCRPDRA